MSFPIGANPSATSALGFQRDQVNDAQPTSTAPTERNTGAFFDFFSFFSGQQRSATAPSATSFSFGMQSPSALGGVNAGPSANACRVNVGIQTDPTGCFRTVKAAYARAYPGQTVGALSNALPATAGTQGLEEIKAALARGEAVPVAVHRENGRTDVNVGSYGNANHCVMLVPNPDGTIGVQDPGSSRASRGTATFDASGNITFETWDRMQVVSMLPINARPYA